MQEQWLSPTTHAGCEWEDCAYAHDGNEDTVAWFHAYKFQWTPWLVVGLPPVETDRIRIVEYGAWIRFNSQIEIYKDGAWVNIYSAGAGHITGEYVFSPGVLEGIRVRGQYWYLLGDYWNIGISEIQYWGLGPEEGPWTGVIPTSLCDFFHSVGTFFTDLASDILDLWLIGEFLSAPFEFLGGVFHMGGDFCCAFVVAIEAALNAVGGGITVDALLAIIQDHWPTLYNLITDPIGWFLVQLTLAFDLEPWHTQSLEFLAKWILEEYFPALYSLWLDLADGWLGLLEKRSPILYYLVVDPEGEIRYLIGQWFNLEPYQVGSWGLIFKFLMETYFPVLWELYLDPELWLEEHAPPPPEGIYSLLEDPLGWLTDTLKEHFPVLYYLVVDPAGQMLYLIGQAFDLDPWEAQSPEFIVKALFERWFPTLYELWRVLWAWAGEHDLDLVELLSGGLAFLWRLLTEGFGAFLDLITFPGKQVWDGFFGWVDAVQARGETFMAMSFRVNVGDALDDFEATWPELEGTWDLIEQDMEE